MQPYTILILGAAVILIWQTIQGWRLGLLRQLVRLGALVGAWFFGRWAFTAGVPHLQMLGYPDPVLAVIAFAVEAVIAYAFICTIGAILFKRTAHQTSSVVWVIYGTAGAFLGAVLGLIILIGATSAIRLFDTVSPETQTGLRPTLESGWAGKMLMRFDPLPKRTYVIAGKISKLSTQPEALMRFLDDPAAQALTALPEIQALRRDPDILPDLRAGKWNTVLKNPNVVTAANSPQVTALLKKFDWEKALDDALEPPASPPL